MTPAHDRRQRLHELVIALIAQQDDLPLLDPDQPDLEGTAPGRWLDQNRRSLHRCGRHRPAAEPQFVIDPLQRNEGLAD